MQVASTTSTFPHLPLSSGPRALQVERLVPLFLPSSLSSTIGELARASTELQERTLTTRTPPASRTRIGSPLSQATTESQTLSSLLALARKTGTGCHLHLRSTILAPSTAATSSQISTLEEASSQGLGRQRPTRCDRECPLDTLPLKHRLLGTSGVASTGGI